ncbi:hypothetical protein [Aquabacterium sp. OR-4]|uniref:hypothetical protein n=1 Tax=Aquabacterium sp. OR-4 TaxID=2978127 RepID=UPI0021B3AB21|nr:hypothetical protein [Aquabacterium sp. OR-4]MDT7835307.1 hypothetical protein [Aquabacterium sp. OR-4]
MSTGRFTLRALAVLWPAFLMAGVLEMLVFALVDPATLHWFGGAPVELAPAGVYTLAFFVFWGVIATAGALTQLLHQTADELNQAESGPGRPRWPA